MLFWKLKEVFAKEEIVNLEDESVESERPFRGQDRCCVEVLCRVLEKNSPCKRTQVGTNSLSVFAGTTQVTDEGKRRWSDTLDTFIFEDFAIVESLREGRGLAVIPGCCGRFDDTNTAPPVRKR